MSVKLLFETSDKQVIACKKDVIVPYAQTIEQLFNEGKITIGVPYKLERVNAKTLTKILEFTAIYNARLAMNHPKEKEDEWQLQQFEQEEFKDLLLASAILKIGILRPALAIRFDNEMKNNDTDSEEEDDKSIPITFMTSDKETIECDDYILPYSKIIKTLFDEGKITAGVPYTLDRVAANELIAILDFNVLSKKEESEPTEEGQQVITSGELSCKSWELDFVQQFEKDELVDLILASEFLEVDSLHTVGCMRIAKDMEMRLLQDDDNEDFDSDDQHEQHKNDQDGDENTESVEKLEEQLYRLLMQ